MNDELRRAAEGMERDHPRFNAERGAHAERLDRQVVGEYQTRLGILLGAVLLVLVIACGNAANLLLARLASRSRELAVRAAIGAGRGRIVRQVVAESLVLAAGGALAGVVVAAWAVPLLVAAAPEGVPRLDEAALNASVLAVAGLLTVASAVAVGALPAWSATSGSLRNDLGDGKGTSSGSLRPWVRQALIGAQATMVLIVLAGAALLVRSAINLQQVPIGFDTGNVLRGRVGLPAGQYREPAIVRATFESLASKLTVAPGVAAAALDSQAPIVSGGGTNGLIPEGRPLAIESVINSQSHFVTPGYFNALRLPLVAGRGFDDRDVRSSPLVMIVNEALAADAFPGESPIGKRVACCEIDSEATRWKTVIGMVPDVRSSGPAGAVVPEFYLPIAQLPDPAWSWIQNSMDLIVRPADGVRAESLAASLRSAVAEVDPNLPVYGIRTLDEGLRERMAQARFNMWLMSLLGGIGLVLAALGIYSVVAWLVSQRTREIGVRMALGASPGAVVGQLARHGMAPVVVGLLLGLAGAVGAGRWLQGQLFQVSAADPLALGATALLLLGVAAAAALWPAWRATGIDPARALHDG